MTTLTIGIDAQLFDRIREDVAGIIDDEIVEFGVIVERDSPKGVSDVGQSLSSSYDINPATITANTIEASFFSALPYSLERLAGRGPGKQPPVDKLRRWALANGVNPYAVARKIGREGTERFKEGEDANILKINPRTKVVPTEKGPQRTATDTMIRRIEGLSY